MTNKPDYLPDLMEYLQDICDQIDSIDEMYFGEVQDALDHMACTASKARRLCDSMIERDAKWLKNQTRKLQTF